MKEIIIQVDKKFLEILEEYYEDGTIESFLYNSLSKLFDEVVPDEVANSINENEE